LTEQCININNLVNGKPVLEIAEHEERYFTEHQTHFLNLTDKDNKIKEELERKKIFIDETKKGVKIKTNLYAGVREFENFILKVSPKQVGDIESLGKLIVYCHTKDLDTYDSESIPFQKKYEHPLDFLIRKFVMLCKKLIKSGLYRKYETHVEDVPYLKGKLMIKQQIQNIMKFNMKFNCEFDEYTSNNLENQIILHTLKKCLIISKDEELKTSIQKLIHHIDKQVEDIPIKLSDFRQIHYTRLNKNYQIPLELSKLILENTGMMNIKQLKTQFIVPFIENMPKLFERFLEKLFKNYPGFKVKAQFPHTAWKKNDTVDDLDEDEKSMIPDLVIYENKLKDGDDMLIRENIKFIVDAKYMKDIKLSERYQLAFYIHEYGISKGFAICPTLENTFHRSDNEEITYEDKEAYLLKSEYQGISIAVRHININEFFQLNILNKPKKNIENFLENITKI